MNINVYLAGKISHTDWRHQIVKGLRDIEFDHVVEGRDARITEYPIWMDAIAPGINYSGPYFVSCDHGCFHGTNSHGALCLRGECGGVVDPARNHQDVLWAARKQIERSDVLFAYIDDVSAYGTLIEIGYAKARGKFVVVCTPTPFPDLWFACAMADIALVEEDSKTALWESICVYKRRFEVSVLDEMFR